MLVLGVSGGALVVYLELLPGQRAGSPAAIPGAAAPAGTPARSAEALAGPPGPGLPQAPGLAPPPAMGASPAGGPATSQPAWNDPLAPITYWPAHASALPADTCACRPDSPHCEHPVPGGGCHRANMLLSIGHPHRAEGRVAVISGLREIDIELDALIELILFEYVEGWWGSISADLEFGIEIRTLVVRLLRGLCQRLERLDLSSLIQDLSVTVTQHVSHFRAACGRAGVFRAAAAQGFSPAAVPRPAGPGSGGPATGAPDAWPPMGTSWAGGRDARSVLAAGSDDAPALPSVPQTVFDHFTHGHKSPFGHSDAGGEHMHFAMHDAQASEEEYIRQLCHWLVFHLLSSSSMNPDFRRVLVEDLAHGAGASGLGAAGGPGAGDTGPGRGAPGPGPGPGPGPADSPHDEPRRQADPGFDLVVLLMREVLASRIVTPLLHKLSQPEMLMELFVTGLIASVPGSDFARPFIRPERTEGRTPTDTPVEGSPLAILLQCWRDQEARTLRARSAAMAERKQKSTFSLLPAGSLSISSLVDHYTGLLARVAPFFRRPGSGGAAGPEPGPGPAATPGRVDDPADPDAPAVAGEFATLVNLADSILGLSHSGRHSWMLWLFHLVVRPTLDVFGLNTLVRRGLTTFARGWLLTESRLAYYTWLLRDTLWTPAGRWRGSDPVDYSYLPPDDGEFRHLPEEDALRHRVTRFWHRRLSEELDNLLEPLAKVLDAEAAAETRDLILAVISHPRRNRNILFLLLDVILGHVFPELESTSPYARPAAGPGLEGHPAPGGDLADSHDPVDSHHLAQSLLRSDSASYAFSQPFPYLENIPRTVFRRRPGPPAGPPDPIALGAGAAVAELSAGLTAAAAAAAVTPGDPAPGHGGVRRSAEGDSPDTSDPSLVLTASAVAPHAQSSTSLHHRHSQQSRA
ncbi:hypothetical protein H696_01868 [Fonticula alba]|uniref:PXA domain-containing protein n=1 Tax=Fonticula alba TaxID=691883 RepID=A0A058Z9Y0_FONAL|nr:hypothetical protein H696_01868 [Fonticula alba]KCV70921.1 hypothetical protein H696_01868 [Fonticula alba]|eukprot:XP_009494044.1 hypothetical protein H696_01868 [Fonticula alba]